MYKYTLIIKNKIGEIKKVFLAKSIEEAEVIGLKNANYIYGKNINIDNEELFWDNFIDFEKWLEEENIGVEFIIKKIDMD